MVRLACADDDAQEQALEVYWDYEPDRFILEEEGWKDLAARGFDPPKQFGAFLHNCVLIASQFPTATRVAGLRA